MILNTGAEADWLAGLTRRDCILVKRAQTQNTLLTVAAGILFGIHPSIILKFLPRSMALST